MGFLILVAFCLFAWYAFAKKKSEDEAKAADAKARAADYRKRVIDEIIEAKEAMKTDDGCRKLLAEINEILKEYADTVEGVKVGILDIKIAREAGAGRFSSQDEHATTVVRTENFGVGFSAVSERMAFTNLIMESNPNLYYTLVMNEKGYVETRDMAKAVFEPDEDFAHMHACSLSRGGLMFCGDKPTRV